MLPGILDAPALPWQCQPRAVEAAQRSLVPGAAAARVSEATDPCRMDSRGGFRCAWMLSKSQLAGAGGQVGLGIESGWHRGSRGLRQQRTACGWCLQAAGPPLPRPPEAAPLLSFRSQLIHYPSEDSLISDAKQPPHHSHLAILVIALSVSDILLLVHCLSLPVRMSLGNQCLEQ